VVACGSGTSTEGPFGEGSLSAAARVREATRSEAAYSEPGRALVSRQVEFGVSLRRIFNSPLFSFGIQSSMVLASPCSPTGRFTNNGSFTDISLSNR